MLCITFHVNALSLPVFGPFLGKKRGGNSKLYCGSGLGQLLIMSASAKHNMDISITLFVGFGGLEKGRLL